jgi:hypothetical protein
MCEERGAFHDLAGVVETLLLSRFCANVIPLTSYGGSLL